MWQWFAGHLTVMSYIFLAWVAPVLVVFMAGRLIRGGYRRGESGIALAALRQNEGRGEETNKPRSAAL